MSLWVFFAFLARAAAVDYCQGGGEFDIGYGDCSTYGDSNKGYCSYDYDSATGLYAYQVCAECEACVPSLPSSCSDASSRRRSSVGCGFLYRMGYCSYGGRRRTFGGEAADTCQASCGMCPSLTGPAASCPNWKLGSEGQNCHQVCSEMGETCLEGKAPASYSDMLTVTTRANIVCDSILSGSFPESPCFWEGTYCFYNAEMSSRCSTISNYSYTQRLCCCSSPPATTSSTATPATAATSTTSATPSATTSSTATPATVATSTTSAAPPATTSSTTTPAPAATSTTSATPSATTSSTATPATVATSTTSAAPPATTSSTTTPAPAATSTTSAAPPATTSSTTTPATAVTSTTSTAPSHPVDGTINCSALEDSFTDCAVRIADRFPFDYCSIDSDRAGCNRSCCGQDATLTPADGACWNLSDFWWDCETRIQDHWKDCKDYCLPYQQGFSTGCDKSCCSGAGSTGYTPNSSLPFGTSPNCSDPDLKDQVTDCDTRIADHEQNGQDYCAQEFKRRTCQKTCCSYTPPTVVGCEGLVDLWHDCQVRIWDRYKDGSSYCAIPDNRCGCQLSCCAQDKSGNGSFLSTGTNCSDPSISDLAPDCKVRMANVALTGQDYCADSLRRNSCEKSCCEEVSLGLSSCDAEGIADFWQNCDVRIRDREAINQSYCAVEFDRKGCEKSCCDLDSSSSPTSDSCSLAPSDTASDCAVRIADRAKDGLDYCFLQSDRAACEKSCCLGLGLSVTFNVTVDGIDPDGVAGNETLSTAISSTVAQTVADEAGVDASVVSASIFGSVLNVARRLATASTEISVSIDSAGKSPGEVISAIDLGIMGAIVESIQKVPDIASVQQGTVQVADMTSPRTPTLTPPEPTTTAGTVESSTSVSGDTTDSSTSASSGADSKTSTEPKDVGTANTEDTETNAALSLHGCFALAGALFWIVSERFEL
eukprot:TRINITY_DN3751_c0_g1_i1.p1 TRINITY_DN3751_c0_g1~~TRINITY_DN3751_c0_g1_i1.p1  ORF type:complete len:940 (+),score=127.12 TRINITY_DN3751_c0_g1_i1:114-2933(+)